MILELERRVRSLCPEMALRRDAPMSACTTLRLGGPAELMCDAASEREIAAALSAAAELGVPVTVIGRGSNLLVLDGGIPGLTLRVSGRMTGIRTEGDTLTAQSGAPLTAAANRAAEAGLAGLAFASGIPGTVGGGVLMNAGAYGGEMAQTVVRVSGLRPDGTAFTLTREELGYGYRHSVLMDRDWIITEAAFRLTAGEPSEIRAEMAELNRRRAEKQPLDLPSAGSTFKRPAGGFAAALIDQCGLKGFSIGGAQVSEKHAGFLVNRGGTAADFLALMAHVQAVVAERTDVRLEPEVRIIGVKA